MSGFFNRAYRVSSVCHQSLVICRITALVFPQMNSLILITNHHSPASHQLGSSFLFVHDLHEIGAKNRDSIMHKTKASRDGDTKASRDGETKASRDGDTKASRDGETKASRDGDTKASRDGETKPMLLTIIGKRNKLLDAFSVSVIF